jgi:hypothetical protein
MVFIFIQLLASAVIMIRKCSISAIRKYWYLPVLPMMIGLVLLAIYYISGGSPDINGVKIYNYQEVFCGAIAMMFECGIKIGMIPSCSGYEGMFRRSHINAAVVDKDKEYRYQSLNYDSDIDRESIRISEKEISGGKVIWMENLETIYRLNGMLSDAVSGSLGIVRDGKGLENGIKDIDYYLGIADKINFDRSELEYFTYSLEGILTLARATLVSALERRESRGAHLRSDHLDKSDDYLASTVISYDDGKYNTRLVKEDEYEG